MMRLSVGSCVTAPSGLRRGVIVRASEFKQHPASQKLGTAQAKADGQWAQWVPPEELPRPRKERLRGDGVETAKRTQEAGEEALRRMTDTMNAMRSDMEALVQMFVPDEDAGAAQRTPPEEPAKLPPPFEDVTSDADSEGRRLLAMSADETDKEFYLVAPVPGFHNDEIKVVLGPDNVLSVTGEHQWVEKELREAMTKYRQVKGAERFVRRVRLPNAVNTDGIQARADHGLLIIKLPKRLVETVELREVLIPVRS